MKRAAYVWRVGLLLALVVGFSNPAWAKGGSLMLWLEIGDQLESWMIEQKGSCTHGSFEWRRPHSVAMYGNPITGPGPQCKVKIYNTQGYDKQYAIYEVGMRYYINAKPWVEYIGGTIELDQPVITKYTLSSEGGTITFHRVKQ